MLKELIAGIIIGNLTLFGIRWFEQMPQSNFLELLSEIAISFFLFRIGFSGSLAEMFKIGFRALTIAVVGVIATFFLAMVFVPHIAAGLTTLQYVFIAAALTTTSVGITARILKDYGIINSTSSQIILGAAVFDDIISLLILAVITAQTNSNLTSFTNQPLVIAKILLFILIGIVIGQIAGQYLPNWSYKIHPYIRTKYFIIFLFFVVFFVASKMVGLSPVVGAFIGGLVLERRFFNSTEQREHGKQIELRIEKISNLFVPIFFILTGARMGLVGLLSYKAIVISLGLLVIAFVGKLVCGLVARKADNRWLIGLGMVPRGEVGLIFASTAYATGILPQTISSAIIIVVIGTTIITPYLLQRVILKIRH